MLAIATLLTSVAGVVTLMIIIHIRGRHPTRDLGSVSDHWIAQHRIDAP
jgi:hypothetical protein